MTVKTRPAVYILESLDSADDCDGELLARFLRLAGIDHEYTHLRTEEELVHFLDDFEKSSFRYLHLSCHGNESELVLTLKHLKMKTACTVLGRVLAKRRLFLSACSITNETFARKIFENCPQCYSVIGPAKDIRFSDSAIFWASFYHLMAKKDGTRMKRKDIEEAMTNLVHLYGVQMNAFLANETAATGFDHVILE